MSQSVPMTVPATDVIFDKGLFPFKTNLRAAEKTRQNPTKDSGGAPTVELQRSGFRPLPAGATHVSSVWPLDAKADKTLLALISIGQIQTKWESDAVENVRG